MSPKGKAAELKVPEPPKKKRGRPPKVEKERIKARTTGGVSRKIPQGDIDEIQAMTAAAHISADAECPVCCFSDKKRQRCEEDLFAVTADVVTPDGMRTIGQVAVKYGVKAVDLLRHRDKCMVKEAVLVLDKPRAGNAPSMDIENSAAWIKQLAKYLEVADGVIANEQSLEVPDPRVLLAAAAEGRKICETNAKLFLELYRLRLDKRVMDDFIRSVLEVLEKVAPAAKDEVIRQLKGRLALTTAAGIGGM